MSTVNMHCRAHLCKWPQPYNPDFSLSMRSSFMVYANHPWHGKIKFGVVKLRSNTWMSPAMLVKATKRGPPMTFQHHHANPWFISEPVDILRVPAFPHAAILLFDRRTFDMQNGRCHYDSHILKLSFINSKNSKIPAFFGGQNQWLLRPPPGVQDTMIYPGWWP